MYGNFFPSGLDPASNVDDRADGLATAGTEPLLHGVGPGQRRAGFAAVVHRSGRRTDALGLPFLPVLVFTVVLFFGSLCCPAASSAREAQISDVLLAKNQDTITVFARVTNCFTTAMESAILAGVPTTFTFHVDFYQEKNFWPDKKLASVVLRQTIKYDNVKKIFLVFSSGGNPMVFPDLEGAKRAMAEMTATVTIPRNINRRLGTYYLLIKARLDKVRLPLYMEYVFFFVSLWDFETDWYRKEVSF
ncbi:MAG TPA: DUF4390 domain-containing protein [Syntrophales bacterium]|nr:DUF4390 domain-containing protein [Syntrophales bacterium]HON23172.1 DUF4390 domain-containing protein [Syntrophales bacterium]HRR46698.1 DUF4390 domain-containing protein [Syntrophales bacterium]